METILRKDKRRELPTSWELTRIGNVVDSHGGSTPSTAEPEYWDDGGILWATPTDITSLNTKYISDTVRKISQKAADETSLRLCEPGTLLMTSRATIGYPAIAQKPITTNQGFINIHCGNKVETLFLYYWIAQNRALLERFAQGSTFLELSKKDFRRFALDLPPLPEQRKIAEILSMVDETIEKTDAIIRETQQLKKGLMQKLFTEGIGHTRFKETTIGRIPEEWGVVTIRDVGDVRGGKRLPKGEQFAQTKTEYPYIRVIDFQNMSICVEQLEYLTVEVQRTISRYTISSNDVYISIAGTIGLVGTIPHRLDGANLTENAAKICDLKKIDKTFLAYYLSAFQAQKQISSFIGISTQPKLALNRIEKIRLPMPGLDEQRKIAEILSEVDAGIEKEQSFKSELEQLKEGLMQVLLTGKVRVRV